MTFCEVDHRLLAAGQTCPKCELYIPTYLELAVMFHNREAARKQEEPKFVAAARDFGQVAWWKE